MLPLQLSASFQSGNSGPVTSGAASGGSQLTTADATSAFGSDPVTKYALLGVGGLVVLVLLMSAVRK